MAKNDKKKTEATLNQQTGQMQNSQNNTYGNTMGMYQDFKNNYDSAVPMQMQDYRDLMDQYKSYTNSLPANNRISAERVSYDRTPEMQKALSGYGEFADTGGFSGQDKSDIRSRALSPVTAVYQNMQNEMARQKNLQGGYSPNFNAAAARMRGGASQQMSDITQQVNAKLAEMVQQGRLAGLGGLGQLSATDTNFNQEAQYHNQSAALEAARANQIYGAYDPRLQALNAASSLYGATPGMAALFGGEMLGANGQLLQSNQQQQNIGNFAMNGRQMVNQTPSNFEVGLGRVKDIAGMAGSVYSGLGGLFKKTPQAGPAMGGGSGPISSTYNPMGQVSFPPGSMSFPGGSQGIMAGSQSAARNIPQLNWR